MDAKKVGKRRSVGGTREDPASAGSAPRGRAVKRKPNRYTFEQKLRAVKLHLEEGIDVKTILSEIGVYESTFYGWVRRYKSEGEDGLKGTKGGKKPRLIIDSSTNKHALTKSLKVCRAKE